MDLTNYQFPEHTNTPKDLLQEAIDRKFYNAYTPYNKLFSDLFFTSGRVQFKEDVDPEFKNRAWSYLRRFIGSWSPKHEEKEAICAMLLSEMCKPELAPAEGAH